MIENGKHSIPRKKCTKENDNKLETQKKKLTICNVLRFHRGKRYDSGLKWVYYNFLSVWIE